MTRADSGMEGPASVFGFNSRDGVKVHNHPRSLRSPNPSIPNPSNPNPNHAYEVKAQLAEAPVVEEQAETQV